VDREEKAMQTSRSHRPAGPQVANEHDEVVRAVGVFGLSAVAVVHLAQIGDTFDHTPWLGAAFVLLGVACVWLAGQLLHRGSRTLWAQTAVLNGSAIVGYIFTRLASTPFDNQDVGNWSETLGVAALFIEALMLLLSVHVLTGMARSAFNPEVGRRNLRDPQRV
jgi:hypothetical protein